MRLKAPPALVAVVNEMIREDDPLPDYPSWEGHLGPEPPPFGYPGNGSDHSAPKRQAPGEDLLPLKTFDAGDWEGVPIEPRRWIVHNRIPVGEPGIMSGDGGTGKTKLMLQLAVAVSAELPDWVNGLLETHGPVIFYSAEEKLAEMHRRVADVLAHRGLEFSVVARRLHFICDHDDITLAKADHKGTVTPTLSLHRLQRTVALLRPAIVVIENAADVYEGDENNRTAVTKFVRHMLGSLAVPNDATPVLIQHPSLSGLANGTGTSGSTGWNNAGRWRLNFTRDKTDETGARELTVIKGNYGPDLEKVRVVWDRGVFVPEGSASPSQRAAAEAPVDEVFLKCLATATAQGRHVSPNRSSAYAPAVFEKMADAAGIKKSGLEKAMERLLADNRIRVDQGPRGTRQIVKAP
jgi:RecA-family ATPase